MPSVEMDNESFLKYWADRGVTLTQDGSTVLSSTTTTTLAPITTTMAAAPAVHSLLLQPELSHLPTLCKNSDVDKSFQSQFYCYALLALWIMLMISAILYQIRALLSVKTVQRALQRSVSKKEEEKPLAKDEAGSWKLPNLPNIELGDGYQSYRNTVGRDVPDRE
jgi:hypothetical protein